MVAVCYVNFAAVIFVCQYGMSAVAEQVYKAILVSAQDAFDVSEGCCRIQKGPIDRLVNNHLDVLPSALIQMLFTDEISEC